MVDRYLRSWQLNDARAGVPCNHGGASGACAALSAWQQLLQVHAWVLSVVTSLPLLGSTAMPWPLAPAGRRMLQHGLGAVQLNLQVSG